MQVRVNWKPWALVLVIVLAAIVAARLFLAKPGDRSTPPVPTVALDKSDSHSEQAAPTQPLEAETTTSPPPSSAPDASQPDAAPESSASPPTAPGDQSPASGWTVSDEAATAAPQTETDAPPTDAPATPSQDTADALDTAKTETAQMASSISPNAETQASTDERGGNGNGLRVKVHKTEAASEPTKSSSPTAPEPAQVSHVCYFGFDSSRLGMSERERLNAFLTTLDQQRVSKVRVDGHTCSIGSDAYNQGLSERRAETVARFIDQKAPPSTGEIVVHGFGENWPAHSNDTREGRRKNRRVEIFVAFQAEQQPDTPAVSLRPAPAQTPVAEPDREDAPSHVSAAQPAPVQDSPPTHEESAPTPIPSPFSPSLARLSHETRFALDMQPSASIQNYQAEQAVAPGEWLLSYSDPLRVMSAHPIFHGEKFEAIRHDFSHTQAETAMSLVEKSPRHNRRTKDWKPALPSPRARPPAHEMHEMPCPAMEFT